MGGRTEDYTRGGCSAGTTGCSCIDPVPSIDTCKHKQSLQKRFDEFMGYTGQVRARIHIHTHTHAHTHAYTHTLARVRLPLGHAIE